MSNIVGNTLMALGALGALGGINTQNDLKTNIAQALGGAVLGLGGLLARKKKKGSGILPNHLNIIEEIPGILVKASISGKRSERPSKNFEYFFFRSSNFSIRSNKPSATNRSASLDSSSIRTEFL